MTALRTAALAAILLGASAGFAAADRSAFSGAEPLTLLSDGAIAACGTRLRIDIDGTALAIDLLLTKSGEAGTLALSAGYDSPGSTMLPVTKVDVRTASVSTSDIFLAPGRFEADGTLILEAPATDGRISTFFQELMVGGGTAEIAREFMLAPDTITIPGPLPQPVRAAYLACAGDLVRPADPASP